MAATSPRTFGSAVLSTASVAPDGGPSPSLQRQQHITAQAACRHCPGRPRVRRARHRLGRPLRLSPRRPPSFPDPHLDGLHRYEDGPLVLAQRWRYLSFALSEDPGDTALALRLVNDLGKFICARQEQGVNQVEDCRSNG